MHTIHIGIGGYYNVVVAQAFHAFFYVEGVLQQVELFIFIHYLLGKAVAVERLTPQTEHRLSLYLPALGDATAGRVALGDEDG